MRCVAELLAFLVLAATVACGPTESKPEKAEPVINRPEPVAGNAKEFGMRFTRIFMKAEDSGINVRFEIQNDGRGIINLVSVPNESGTEAALFVETYRDGKWFRKAEPIGPSDKFKDIWPSASEYGRAMVEPNVHWMRVYVKAKDLSRIQDGTSVAGTQEVFSDAFDASDGR